jgi:predicted amidohydrolase YtcJ
MFQLYMPDLLVVGTLHTMDASRPRAQAALMREGKFARVGTREECERDAQSDVKFIELGEGCAVPGLADAHGHPLLHGRYLAEVRLAGAASEQECAGRVQLYSQFVPQGQWIRGNGWDQNLWPGREFPDAASLGAVRQPVALMRVDVHALWCNDAALQAAGITRTSVDPPGGRILRRDDGSPSGVLLDNAMDLVRRAIPPPAAREAEETLLRSLQALVASGITSVHDASAGPEVLDAYARLAQRDVLPLRIYAMIDGQGPWERVEELMRFWRETPAADRLVVRSVKLFADGALGSRGAALFEPYEDDSGNTGLWLMEPEELSGRIARIAAAGFQPCVHCIGDRACAVTLEAFAAVPREVRPRAEHLQVLRTRDVPLLKRSGAIASMQPSHAVSDGVWAEARLGRGTERQRGAYAWRQALEAGVPLAFGSDFPVESMDPRQGLRAAVARKTAAGTVWMPEQRLTRAEALHAFTAGAAYAEFAESRRGLIREGFDADLTVFARDVMEVHVDELPQVRIEATVVGGSVEHAGP